MTRCARPGTGCGYIAWASVAILSLALGATTAAAQSQGPTQTVMSDSPLAVTPSPEAAKPETAKPDQTGVGPVAAPTSTPFTFPESKPVPNDAPPANNQADFDHWRTKTPERDSLIAAFEAYLDQQGVLGVVPTYQLLRTATDAGKCDADLFALPTQPFWHRIVPTLRFVRDRVKPVVGEVEAVSAFRPQSLNACAGGNKSSAHRLFTAVDLRPVAPVKRYTLFRRLCALHSSHGRAASVGLGLYNGLRFHIDTSGFRRWGDVETAESSPCLEFEGRTISKAKPGQPRNTAP
ncbi:MAG: hypothetical protein ACK41P_06550 [Asticcacaulis sp.]